MLGDLLSFHLVKKMGEGNYLREDRFILERIRRERALDIYNTESKKKKYKIKRRHQG